MRYHLILVIATTWLLSAGCDSKNTDNVHTVERDRITIWYLSRVPEFETFIRPALTQFEQEYNLLISIRPCTLLELKDLARKDSSSLSQNTIPDIVILPSQYVPFAAEQGYIIPTDTLFTDDLPAVSQQCVYKDVSYGAPFACNTKLLFVNKNLVELRPDSSGILCIDSIIDVCQNWSDTTAHAWGAHGPEYSYVFATIASWLCSLDGQIMTRNGVSVLDSDKNYEAMGTYVELARIGLMETQRQLERMFLDGKLAMLYANASLIEPLGSAGLDYTYAMVGPSDISVRPPSAVVYSISACLTSACRSKVAAQRCVRGLRKLLTGPSVIGFPTTTKYWKSPAFRHANRDSLLQASIFSGTAMPASSHWPEIERRVEQAFISILLDGSDVEESLSDAQEDIIEIVRR